MSGPQAEYAQIAYERAMQLNKSNPISGLEKITQQLEGVSNVVSKADYAIHRFFTEPDYLPKETIQALNLLMTEDVPLKKLDAIKDDELREYFIGTSRGNCSRLFVLYSVSPMLVCLTQLFCLPHYFVYIFLYIF